MAMEAFMKLHKVAGVLWMSIILSCFAFAIDQPIASYRIDSTRDMMPKWDDANHRVLSYQSQTATDPVGVQITSIDGTEQTVQVNVLKDFPGAVGAILVDIAPGLNRSVVVACRLKYPKHNNAPALKELILTYDFAGKLTKVWDVAPYEPSVISTDEGGNVYAFAVRFDVFGKTSGPDYGTLVEYSSDGKIVKEMLPSSLFPLDVDPAAYSGQTGPPFMRVSRDRIYVYAAMLSEVFVLDKSGAILKRYTTKSPIRELAAGNHYASREMIAGAFDSNGDLYFDVGLSDPVAKGLPNAMRVGAKLNAGSLQSSQWLNSRETAGKDVVLDKRMIGVTADGSVVCLVRARGDFSIEITSH
jgi:hypothetical protein